MLKHILFDHKITEHCVLFSQIELPRVILLKERRIILINTTRTGNFPNSIDSYTQTNEHSFKTTGEANINEHAKEKDVLSVSKQII